MKDNVVLEFDRVSKSFQDGKRSLTIFEDVSFRLKEGEHIAIVGQSGSGKSTLLQLMGGLDAPNSGKVILQGNSYEQMSESDIDTARNKKLGFVYQFHHLLPEFTALENVMIPMLVANISVEVAKKRSMQTLIEFGLEYRLGHIPAKLSGGEKQRVAIARAIVQKPKCLLADEPTGNLDPQTAKTVIEAIQNISRSTSVVVVTHDLELANRFDKVYQLENGVLV